MTVGNLSEQKFKAYFFLNRHPCTTGQTNTHFSQQQDLQQHSGSQLTKHFPSLPKTWLLFGIRILLLNWPIYRCCRRWSIQATRLRLLGLLEQEAKEIAQLKRLNDPQNFISIRVIRK